MVKKNSNGNGKSAPEEPIQPRVISESWFEFISFVQDNLPNSEIKVKFINGEPTQLLDWTANIRFDRGPISTETAKLTLLSPQKK